MTVALVRLPEVTSALLPSAVLLDPVVFAASDRRPFAVFQDPVVFNKSDR